MKDKLLVFLNLTTIVCCSFVAIVRLESRLSVPKAPSPVQVIAPTEAQIKEQVKHEKEETRRAKAIARATAAARAVYRQNGCDPVYSDLTGRTAYELGLSSRLLAAVVFTESSCRASAVSGRDSIGLLQINYRVWKQHTKQEYLNPDINMKMGAWILYKYIQRHGLEKGLHAYNGFGNPTNEYAAKVLLAAGMTK